jgi:hypothetical protein
MKRMSIMDEAREHGRQLITRGSIRAMLAMAAARAVAAGEVGPEDADRIYAQYFDAVAVRTKTQSPVSHKVQVSKLRQVMLADKHGMQVLDRVVKLHGSTEGQVGSLYDVMVEVARNQLQRRARLTDAELIKIMRKS